MRRVDPTMAAVNFLRKMAHRGKKRFKKSEKISEHFQNFLNKLPHNADGSDLKGNILYCSDGWITSAETAKDDGTNYDNE